MSNFLLRGAIPNKCIIKNALTDLRGHSKVENQNGRKRQGARRRCDTCSHRANSLKDPECPRSLVLASAAANKVAAAWKTPIRHLNWEGKKGYSLLGSLQGRGSKLGRKEEREKVQEREGLNFVIVEKWKKEEHKVPVNARNSRKALEPACEKP